MKYRSFFSIAVAVIIFIPLSSCRENVNKKICILETTDIHGVILPYDFIEKKPLNVSLANSVSCFETLRKENDVLFLLDDGDNLQGQPEVYYYNFIDTVTQHFLSEAMNRAGYDACTAGNHDIEAGHSVYDRLVKEYNFPLLAANAVDKKSGQPYFKPYIIIEKKGISIAVLGMVTPSIPAWLPEELYSGIEFRDMTETAKKWMPEILKKKPDLVVGLFHSGWDTGNEGLNKGSHSDENGSAAVSFNVPGFDIIFCGHDHKLANTKFINSQGDTILIMNAGSRSENIAKAEVSFSSKKPFRKRHKNISGTIINVKDYPPDQVFLEKFRSRNEEINRYVNKKIATCTRTFSSRQSYFGPSAFVDMIHSLQLEITGADVSFAAPLSFDVKISEGPVTVSDMFKLYRFENMLYTISMSGEEIHKYLEYSYSEWFNTMKGPDDPLLKLKLGRDGKPVIASGKAWLMGQAYNFDSAAGINYIVDVSKPEGERITIISFSDGRHFEEQKRYKVAVNSYRGNGGGGHFTNGVGLDNKELRSRMIASTDRDLRYYIMKSIEEKGIINPAPFNNWKIVPEKWVKSAVIRDYKVLFGIEMSADNTEYQIIK